jgi:hypothetical protein
VIVHTHQLLEALLQRCVVCLHSTQLLVLGNNQVAVLL